MSIKLCVDPYCHDCPNFSVEVEKTELNGFGGTFMCETVIKCRNATQCQRIIEFLRTQHGPNNFGL